MDSKLKGTLARVFAAYPLAIPAVMMLLATVFPQYIMFDEAAGRVTVTFTVTELVLVVGGGFGGGYALIAGVFAKWGIKR